MSQENIAKLISMLNMSQHPEGGYFVRSYSDDTVGISSAYFLLANNEISHWHTIQSDELLMFHSGDSLRIYVISPNNIAELAKAGLSELHSYILGSDVVAGQKPQIHIPAYSILAMERISDCPNNQQGYSLISCVVAPPFSFDRFRLCSYNELKTKYSYLNQDILKKFSSN